MHNKVTKRMHLPFYLMTFTFKYEHVSAVEGAPDDSSEGTSTFKIETKGTLEVTTELHVKIHMVVRLLARKSSQNYSIKRVLEEALY